jgi:flagellar protein FlaG
MYMPISNISPSASFGPTPELPGVPAKSGKQRVAVEKLVASLPGNKKPQDIHRMAADVARVSQTFNKKLHFVVDHQSHEVIVKVIDKETDKVIKVLPPEELQRLHRKLRETIGYLFSERT